MKNHEQLIDLFKHGSAPVLAPEALPKGLHDAQKQFVDTVFQHLEITLNGNRTGVLPETAIGRMTEKNITMHVVAAKEHGRVALVFIEQQVYPHNISIPEWLAGYPHQISGNMFERRYGVLIGADQTVMRLSEVKEKAGTISRPPDTSHDAFEDVKDPERATMILSRLTRLPWKQLQRT